jgi:hypothetical protein
MRYFPFAVLPIRNMASCFALPSAPCPAVLFPSTPALWFTRRQNQPHKAHKRQAPLLVNIAVTQGQLLDFGQKVGGVCHLFHGLHWHLQDHRGG